MAKQTWQKKFLNEIMKQSNLRKNEFSDAPFWLSKDKIELLPKSLVKFFSPNIYSFLSLNNKSLYFATPSSFNDPYDCYLGANNEEYVKKYLLKYIEDNSFIEERIITEDERNRLSESRAFDSGDYYNIYESFSSAFNSIVLSKEEEKQNKLRLAKIIANRNFEYTIKNLRNNNIRVCCFSEMSKNELASHVEMWSHYADNHKGFCVEYDIARFKEDCQNYYSEPRDSENYQYYEKQMLNMSIFAGIFPCLYNSQMIKITTSQLLNKKDTQEKRNRERNRLMKTFLTKYSKWNYENEWRVVLSSKLLEKYGFALPFPYIKAIYLGSRIEKHYKEAILNIAKREEIKAYTSSLSHNRYELEFYPIDIDFYFKYKDLIDLEGYKYK